VIFISFLLVIAGAATLLVGVFFTDDLTMIYVTLGLAVLAAIFLFLGIARSRPRRAQSPPLADAAPASWSGAAVGTAAPDREAAAREQGAAEEEPAIRDQAEKGGARGDGEDGQEGREEGGGQGRRQG
jgi:hypothetical protein